MVLMNRYLPEYQFEEHHSTVVRAAPGALLDAARAVVRETDPLVNGFIALREFPARGLSLVRRQQQLPSRPFGFEDFTELGRIGKTEMAFGLAGRFWQLSHGLRRVSNATDFDALQGTPKLLLNFVTEPLANSEVKLSTTTRVGCPDKASRRNFTPCWYLIRPVSGLIRKRLLRRIKQRAQTVLRA
ncbi:hypothetical protein E5678_01170 [Hydrogenophaga sp. PAMC20947]|nr:hypothetical protein E5678_01170 [Hydrogenophaga sp. PAMC20947]